MPQISKDDIISHIKYFDRDISVMELQSKDWVSLLEMLTRLEDQFTDSAELLEIEESYQ